MTKEKEEDKYEAVLKLDRAIEVTKKSRVPIEEKLETLPALIFIKDTEVYRKSSEIEKIKPKIKNMEQDAFNRKRAETVEGAKEGVTKPKYTVDQATYESKLQLSIHDETYKQLKETEKNLHIEYEMMKLERMFLENSFKAARTLAWLKASAAIMETIG